MVCIFQTPIAFINIFIAMYICRTQGLHSTVAHIAAYSSLSSYEMSITRIAASSYPLLTSTVVSSAAKSVTIASRSSPVKLTVMTMTFLFGKTGVGVVDAVDQKVSKYLQVNNTPT